MEDELIIAMMNRAWEEVPELSLIDEDYGQLDADQETYPVTFPCLLIGYIETDWEGQTPQVQTGKNTLVTRLAMDCYDDTHMGSGTTEKIRERHALKRKVYKTFQGFSFDPSRFGYLDRIKSRDFSLPGNIKVYETMYAFESVDDSISM